MTLPRELPLDIIQIIAGYTDWVPENLTHWKHRLQIIAVCRAWRITVMPLVYRSAMIEVVNGESIIEYGYHLDEFDHDPTYVFTNITLIQQNGYQNLVKRLNIVNEDHELALPIIARMAEALGLCAEQNTWVSQLNKLFDEHVGQNSTPMEMTERRMSIEGSAHLANILLKMLPKVNTIRIDAHSSADDFRRFVEYIVEKHSNQLVRFEYNSYAFVPARLESESLRHLALTFFNLEDDGHISIQANHLQNISLDLHDSVFQWSMFQNTEHDGAMVFRELEYIHLRNTHEFAYLGDVSENNMWFSEPKPALRFPNLKTMKIMYTCLDGEDYKYIFESPIKQFSYEGTLVDALRICKHKIHVLDILNLTFNMVGDGLADEDVVPMLNKIFSLTGNIYNVFCNIHLTKLDFDISSVYWPNLTHLELSVIMEIHSIVDAIPKLPNLVNFELKFYSLNNGVITRATEFFGCMKTGYTPLVDSKLRVLCLGAGNTIWPPEFVGAASVFYWYLPRLKLLDISCAMLVDRYIR